VRARPSVGQESAAKALQRQIAGGMRANVAAEANIVPCGAGAARRIIAATVSSAAAAAARGVAWQPVRRAKLNDALEISRHFKAAQRRAARERV
jgi:hypothetical protein